MKAFAALHAALDTGAATHDKLEALRRYFEQAPAPDAPWALYLLAGGRLRRSIPTARLRELACRDAGLPPWLFDECHQAVGDLAETIALVLPPGDGAPAPGLAIWMEHRLLPLQALPAADRAPALARWWRELDPPGRWLLIKLVGGGFRAGVGRPWVVRALAEARRIDPMRLARRMIGYTDGRTLPDAARYEALFVADDGGEAGQPYPFMQAHPLAVDESRPAARLGPVADWLVEWQHGGLRAQLVRQGGLTWIWSLDEALPNERFPEVCALAASLPDGTVLDGEIVAWRGDAPAPFELLQPRLGHQRLTQRMRAATPVAFVACDLLQAGGDDLRTRPLHERRVRLEALCAAAGLQLSPRLWPADWAAVAGLRALGRERGAEGVMLKALRGGYVAGDSSAVEGWWTWKAEPLRLDAVLVQAQAGQGRHAGAYVGLGFALWSRVPEDAAEAQAVVEAIARREPPAAGALRLVGFAKASSGLSDAETAEIDRIVRATTLDKFGPVRSLRPTLVVELGLESVRRSARHKSGMAVRSARMLRLRRDQALHEAGTLDSLLQRLPADNRA